MHRSATLAQRAGPDGLHFFDRDSGLNVLLDEVSVPREAWSKAPRFVSIALTNRCDLQCGYCYAPKHRAVLEYERIVSWLEELTDAGCLGVGFGGGEPTLFPRFAELCRAASQATQMAVSFTTHGHRLTTTLLEAIAGKVNFIRISVDGTGNTYERLRGRMYSTLVERMWAASSVAPLGLNVVVNADTVGCLDDIAALAERVHAAEIALLPQRQTAHVAAASTSVRRSLRAWVANYTGTTRLAVSESDCDGLPICDPLPREKGLRAYAHIDASGLLRSSSYSTTHAPIGPEGLLAALDSLTLQEQAE